MPGRVLLAAPRGFCAGVSRAVTIVEMALERYGPPVYVRRQIVHNGSVVARLSRLGAVFVEELDSVPAEAVLVFSAHGVSPAVHADAQQRRLHVIDATCPLVTKVHREARLLAARGTTILLVGEPGHDEVIGVRGEAPDLVHVVRSADDLDGIPLSAQRDVAWLSQTTLAVDDANAVAAGLRARLPQLIDPPSDDICYAAQNRQAGVRLLAREAQLILVAGSANSHNSAELVRVAQANGVPGRLVDDGSGIEAEWLSGVDTVGVTGGASAPETAIASVLQRLAALGFTDVEEVTAAREEQVFALPREV